VIDTKHLRRYIEELVFAVEHVCAAIDREMAKPSDVERGRRIALLMNALEMQKDETKHFGLGLPLDKPMKRPRSLGGIWRPGLSSAQRDRQLMRLRGQGGM